MRGRAVNLRVGGSTYRVVSSAEEAELQRLASTLDAKLADLGPKVTTGPNALLLAALALAHDVETERLSRETLERRTRDLLRRVLVRVDGCIDSIDEPDGHG